MHVLLTTTEGDKVMVKKCDIRRASKVTDDVTSVVFAGAKNTPIRIKGSVQDFYAFLFYAKR